MFGYNAMQFVGSVVTAVICLGLLVRASRNSKLSTRQRFMLLVVLPLVLFTAMGEICEPTGGSTQGWEKSAGKKIVDGISGIAGEIDSSLDDAGVPNNILQPVYDSALNGK